MNVNTTAVREIRLPIIVPGNPTHAVIIRATVVINNKTKNKSTKRT
jgi:hypothetical protein